MGISVPAGRSRTRRPGRSPVVGQCREGCSLCGAPDGRQSGRRPPADHRKVEFGCLFTEARSNNKKRGITGALLLSEDRFVQVLEGDEDAVLALFAHIERDGDTTRSRCSSRAWWRSGCSPAGPWPMPRRARHPADRPRRGDLPAAGRGTTPEQDQVLDAMRNAAARAHGLTCNGPDTPFAVSGVRVRRPYSPDRGHVRRAGDGVTHDRIRSATAVQGGARRRGGHRPAGQGGHIACWTSTPTSTSALDVAAPVDLAVAANANVAAPIKAAGGRQRAVGRLGRRGAEAHQGANIDQGLSGSAVAHAAAAQRHRPDHAATAGADRRRRRPTRRPTAGATATAPDAASSALERQPAQRRRQRSRRTLNLAAPIDGAVAANANVAAPIDASVSANVGSDRLRRDRHRRTRTRSITQNIDGDRARHGRPDLARSTSRRSRVSLTSTPGRAPGPDAAASGPSRPAAGIVLGGCRGLRPPADCQLLG